MSTAVSKSTLNESLPLEDTINTTLNASSRRTSKANYSADESNNDISAVSAVTTPGKGGKANASSGTKSGRGRSSVGLNDSGTTVQPNSSLDEASSPDSKSLNTTAASARSNSRNQSKSSRQSDSEQSSDNNTSLVTPVSKSTRGNKSAPSTMDTNLSAPFSAPQGGRTPGSRRVSFGNMPNLSPIQGSSNKKKPRPSIGSINDPSTDISASTGATGGDGDAYDAYDNNDDGQNYFDEEPDERMVSMESSVHTPETKKSQSRSRLTTPGSATSRSSAGQSSAGSSKSSAKRTPRTPDSLHLSQIDTPQTGELYRGITLPDESYVPEDEDTDREEDASNLNTTRDTTNSSFVQEESSFVDNSLLWTISDKNPNYIGNKDEAKTVLARKPLTISHKKRKAVYTSDEEDAANDLGINSGSEDEGATRRSRRATKGQKFAFWKGERPIYEHGTLVGINQAAKTPVKPKSKSRTSRSHKSSGKNQLFKEEEGASSDEDVVQQPKESEIKLPKNLTYLPRDEYGTIQTWDEDAQKVLDAQVVRCVEDLTPKVLQPSRKRPANKSVNCLAVQALTREEYPDGSMSGWVAGKSISLL